MSKVVLTSSIRTNLLSLQQTAKLQNVVSSRLSTGLKVSTAIDNPSSYYTALSLNNRAQDLNTLLDAMAQGIQTIKTAQTALEAGIELLEQAKTVGETAIENAGIKKDISKSWLIANGVKEKDIVSSRQELLERLATAAAGDTIVVFGNISMGDEKLSLKNGVSLVGAQKIINDLGAQNEVDVGENMMNISFNRTNSTIGIEAQNNALISDLSINFTTNDKSDIGGAIYINNSSGVTVRNINLDFNDNSSSSVIHGAIHVSKSDVTFEGNININVHGTGEKTYAIDGGRYGSASNLTVAEDANINITTTNNWGTGIGYGNWDIKGKTSIYTTGNYARIINETVSLNLSGTLELKSTGNGAADFYGSKVTIKNGALLIVEPKIYQTNSNIFYEKGASVCYPKAGEKYQAKNDISLNTVSYSEISSNANFTRAAASRLLMSPANLRSSKAAAPERYVSEDYYIRYADILGKFDSLIKDASYKGINLLQGDNLNIKFNSEGSSLFDIKEVRADYKNLGINDTKWTTVSSANDALEELQDAIYGIRNLAAEFGNSYSIISTRIEFTENIVNILTEGAEKLSLADMNEESANMQALQTRQKLAVNSLSLASQASQNVLKLF